MSLKVIRQAIVTHWLTGVGINAATPYPAEQLSAMPAAWVGFDDDEISITLSQEVHEHHLPVTVVLNRVGVIENELAALEDLQDAVLARMRGKMTLGGLIYPVGVERVQQGAVTHAGTEFIGVTFRVTCKEKLNVAFIP